MITLDSLKK